MKPIDLIYQAVASRHEYELKPGYLLDDNIVIKRPYGDIYGGYFCAIRGAPVYRYSEYVVELDVFTANFPFRKSMKWSTITTTTVKINDFVLSLLTGKAVRTII